jgi:hypothetical protein
MTVHSLLNFSRPISLFKQYASHIRMFTQYPICLYMVYPCCLKTAGQWRVLVFIISCLDDDDGNNMYYSTVPTSDFWQVLSFDHSFHHIAKPPISAIYQTPSFLHQRPKLIIRCIVCDEELKICLTIVTKTHGRIMMELVPKNGLYDVVDP